MKKMTTGKFMMHEKFNMPLLEVLVDGNVIGYMSPFRGYFFQVSKTYDGQIDLGRSNNDGTNLRHFISNNDYVTFDTFEAFALVAISKCAQVYDVHQKVEETIVRIETADWVNPEWKKFIDASIIWVKENCMK